MLNNQTKELIATALEHKIITTDKEPDNEGIVDAEIERETISVKDYLKIYPKSKRKTLKTQLKKQFLQDSSIGLMKNQKLYVYTDTDYFI